MKMGRLLGVVLLCIVGVINAQTVGDEQPEVTAPVGKIRGSIINSRLGRKIYSFRGVRYAEPPVGQQRFQPPIPAVDWDDVFDGTEQGPGCPRVEGTEGVSEDCLRLNVYSNELPTPTKDVKKPVLVFFHPGAFYSFTGQSSFFGPQYIMDKEILLVVINYRLGSLGFLSTGDSLAPGNMGMKDQVIALRWVRRNIAAFGGDPNAVTISGYSAGGMSVFLHLVSPMSKDLFHRAIVMSGSLISTDKFPNEQKHLAKRQAELLGCPTDTTGSMLICLNSKPVENYTNTVGMFTEWYGDPVLVWRPVVEPEVHGVERFLTDQPLELFKQGKFHQVPLISGITKDEFGGVVTLYEKTVENGNDSVYRELDDNWERIAPISFIYERGTPRSRHISRELKRFYFHDQPIRPANGQGIADLYADSLIIFSMHQATRVIAEHCSKPVYFYKFTYQGRNSFTMRNATTPYGVVHHDDLQYLFYMSFFFPYFTPDAPEIAMLERYTSMWANFVQTGEPIPRNNDLFKGVTWEPYSPRRDNYLEINLNSTMKTGLYPDRMQLWERLFPVNRMSRPTKH